MISATAAVLSWFATCLLSRARAGSGPGNERRPGAGRTGRDAAGPGDCRPSCAGRPSRDGAFGLGGPSGRRSSVELLAHATRAAGGFRRPATRIAVAPKSLRDSRATRAIAVRAGSVSAYPGATWRVASRRPPTQRPSARNVSREDRGGAEHAGRGQGAVTDQVAHRVRHRAAATTSAPRTTSARRRAPRPPRPRPRSGRTPAGRPGPRRTPSPGRPAHATPRRPRPRRGRPRSPRPPAPPPARPAPVPRPGRSAGRPDPYGAKPTTATRTPRTVRTAISSGPPVVSRPAARTACRVWARPASPWSWAWLLARLSTSYPARANSPAYAGGARKATQSVRPGRHLESPAWSVSVPSRLPIMTSGAEVTAVTPASSRTGSGGRPESTLAGTASPDQPTVTAGAEVGARPAGKELRGRRGPGGGRPGGGAPGATAGDPPEQPAASSTAATQARPPRRRIRAA